MMKKLKGEYLMFAISVQRKLGGLLGKVRGNNNDDSLQTHLSSRPCATLCRRDPVFGHTNIFIRPSTHVFRFWIPAKASHAGRE